MSVIYKNLTYEELIKIAPKDKPFQVKVESTFGGKGTSQLLWANIYTNKLDTRLCGQDDISGISYGSAYWEEYYKGKFDLIIDPWDCYAKHEFKKGDYVEGLSGQLTYRLNSDKDDEGYYHLESNNMGLLISEEELYGYYRKIGNPTPQVTELSLKEIADKFNIDLNELRIKE